MHVHLCSVSTRVAASSSVASEPARNPDIRGCFSGAQISAWLCLPVNECECLECVCGRECVRALTSQYESLYRG